MTKHNNNRYTKNLNHVRAAFEKAAFQYDEYSILQRTIADRLDESLEQIKINPKTIITDWNTSVKINEDPYMSEDLPMAYRLNQIMGQKEIVAVVFRGLGDETMAGYNFYKRVKFALDKVTNKKDMFNII